MEYIKLNKEREVPQGLILIMVFHILVIEF